MNTPTPFCEMRNSSGGGGMLEKISIFKSLLFAINYQFIYIEISSIAGEIRNSEPRFSF
jgi:hypothetical protein